MTLVERLEQQARLFDLSAKESTANDSYRQEHRDLANLLLEAAARIKQLERWEMIVPPRPYKRGIKGADHASD